MSPLELNEGALGTTRRAIAWALLPLLLSFLACSDGAPSDPGEPVGAAEDELVSGAPDERQIAGNLTRAVELTGEDGARQCTLPVGNVLVAKYEKGRYRVYLPGRRPCDARKPDSFRGWVASDAVAIEDTAYFGKLKRVNSNSAIAVNMNYAGNKIFCTGNRCRISSPLYGMNRCYLHPQAEGIVQNAALVLQRKSPGAKLALLDCYRPIYVQKQMAALVSDPTWVAQPTPGRYGGHNGGIAIDLSIMDPQGKLLDMGSGFDEFSARSAFAAGGLTAAQRANRTLLRDVMTTAGLKAYDGEWWHFSLAINAQPLDLAL
jgi:D-alanyl-D-alanine dipeptidase